MSEKMKYLRAASNALSGNTVTGATASLGEAIGNYLETKDREQAVKAFFEAFERQDIENAKIPLGVQLGANAVGSLVPTSKILRGIDLAKNLLDGGGVKQFSGKMDGVNQRLFPVERDPEKRNKANDKDLIEWISGGKHDARSSVTPMNSNDEMRAFLKLVGQSEGRTNPQTGKPQVLLHRGLTKADKVENGELVNKFGGRTSATPDRDEAEYLGRRKFVGDFFADKEDLVQVPFATGFFQKKPESMRSFEGEKEVILKPKTYRLENSGDEIEAFLSSLPKKRQTP